MNSMAVVIQFVFLLGVAQNAPFLIQNSVAESGGAAAVSSFRNTVPLLAAPGVQQSRLESLLGSVAHPHSLNPHTGL